MALQTDKLYHSKTPWAPCRPPSAHSPEKSEGKENNLPVRDATNSDGPAVYQCWTLAICGIHGKQPPDGCSAGFRNQVGDGLQSWRWATRSHLWGRACVSATRRTPSGQPPGTGSQVEREPPSPCREAPASSGVWSSVGASGHFCPPHGSAMAISALELAMDQQGDPWLSLPSLFCSPFTESIDTVQWRLPGDKQHNAPLHVSNNPDKHSGVAPYSNEKQWKRYKTFCSKILLFHNFPRVYLQSSTEL